MSVTPMMKQYQEIKASHPDALLLYRMGDFYELFNDDAITASKILGLTLTARNHGGLDKTPLAGFPYHAIERYMPKLIAAGLKVAVCEQTEDPAQAKGIVKREVTELVTRGTSINDNYLDAKSNNYLASIYGEADEALYGFAYVDLSTGYFATMEGSADEICHELYRLNAQEVLLPETLELPKVLVQMRETERTLLTLLPKSFFNFEQGQKKLARQFKVHSLEAFDCGHLHVGIQAAAAALAYARDQKKTELQHLARLQVKRFDAYMTLDAATVRNLELIRPIHTEDEGGTLFHLLDKTVTAMGGRTLKFWLTHPLRDIAAIEFRQKAIAELLQKPAVLEMLRKHLMQINDIERIIAKCGAGRANGRDLAGLGSSLCEAGAVGEILGELSSDFFVKLRERFLPLRQRGEDLLNRFTERPPLTVREGGMIRPGAYEELDALVHSIRDGREWLNGLQPREREATGISTLKVGYNKVFGYYIEVTKAQENKVPGHYIRKQSLVNAERYITPEMKEWENKLLNAESGINALEYKLFCSIRENVNAEAILYLDIAQSLGEIDVINCLAICARDYRFNAPNLIEESSLEIINGRHPVVEAITPEGEYIPNDVFLSTDDRQLLLITGPNMAGKSTYLRQVGLITLLAQIGSFVPADKAIIGLVDRIFTRVGATDRLARGQSTFMVEMIETANILNHATPRSLVLLDEIGRGTSTYDGLSLAWAIVEAIHNQSQIAARTLFATHYHELTGLAENLKRLRNVQVTVRETDQEVIFLRKVIEGGCDSSYGIQVAKMSGIPDSVIARAWEILHQLEKERGVSTFPEAEIIPEERFAKVAEKTPLYTKAKDNRQESQLQVDLFGLTLTPEHPEYELVYKAVLSLDLNGLSPIELVLKINDLQKKFKKA